MKNRITYTFILFIFICSALVAQDKDKAVRKLTLDQIIAQAQGRTSRTTLAKTKLTNQYWNYTAFQGSFKPTLLARATLPEFNRSIARITLPDGQQTFVPQSFVRANAGLSIGQTIPSLGTRLSLFSGIERLDDLDTDDGNTTSYFSTPISIGLEQPLFQHNENKWNQKIRPLIYEEAEKTYIEDMERIAYEAVIAFFDYYIAQLDLEATILDKANADSLYVLAQGRYSVGRIAETEFLQIELNVKSTESAAAQANIDLDNSAEELRKLLNIQDEVYFDLVEPDELSELEIDKDLAVSLAKKYRSQTTAFRRQLLEAEKEVDRAEKNNGLTMDISGSFGLSQTDNTLGRSYTNLLDQERIALSLQIPIADWGRSKAQREIAASQLELTRITIEQQEEGFEREIEIKIRQMALLKNRLELAKSTYELSQKRLDISRKRYYVGKIEIIELNQALLAKESTRKSYYSSLKNYYLGYYQIRGLTLFDFYKNEAIQYD